jgi:hypothetical protein
MMCYDSLQLIYLIPWRNCLENVLGTFWHIFFLFKTTFCELSFWVHNNYKTYILRDKLQKAIYIYKYHEMLHKKNNSWSYKLAITCFLLQIISSSFITHTQTLDSHQYFCVYWVFFIWFSNESLSFYKQLYKETTFQHHPLLSGCILVYSFYHSHSSSLSISWVKKLLSVSSYKLLN